MNELKRGQPYTAGHEDITFRLEKLSDDARFCLRALFENGLIKKFTPFDGGSYLEITTMGEPPIEPGPYQRFIELTPAATENMRRLLMAERLRQITEVRRKNFGLSVKYFTDTEIQWKGVAPFELLNIALGEKLLHSYLRYDREKATLFRFDQYELPGSFTMEGNERIAEPSQETDERFSWLLYENIVPHPEHSSNIENEKIVSDYALRGAKVRLPHSLLSFYKNAAHNVLRADELSTRDLKYTIRDFLSQEEQDRVDRDSPLTIEVNGYKYAIEYSQKNNSMLRAVLQLNDDPINIASCVDSAPTTLPSGIILHIAFPPGYNFKRQGPFRLDPDISIQDIKAAMRGGYGPIVRTSDGLVVYPGERIEDSGNQGTLVQLPPAAAQERLTLTPEMMNDLNRQIEHSRILLEWILAVPTPDGKQKTNFSNIKARLKKASAFIAAATESLNQGQWPQTNSEKLTELLSLLKRACGDMSALLGITVANWAEHFIKLRNQFIDIAKTNGDTDATALVRAREKTKNLIDLSRENIEEDEVEGLLNDILFS